MIDLGTEDTLSGYPKFVLLANALCNQTPQTLFIDFSIIIS